MGEWEGGGEGSGWITPVGQVFAVLSKYFVVVGARSRRKKKKSQDNPDESEMRKAKLPNDNNGGVVYFVSPNY